MEAHEVTQLVRVEVKRILAEMLGVANQTEPETVPLQKAVIVLGYDSVRQLYKDIENGLLRVGIEVEDRRRPGTQKARYYVNIPATRKRLQSPPEKRRGL